MNRTAVAQQSNTGNVLPATQGILQRKCGCGNKTVASGECAECARKKNSLQRKLSIGATNDPLEREADRVADQVMAMPTNSTIGRTPPRIQRFTGQSTDQSDTAPASVDRVLASSGSPMVPLLKQDMEQRFGYDFSQVRVHSGAAAEQSAREVYANAYTVGNNIVFGAGQLEPETHQGRRLVAHELTHVVQQSGVDNVRAGINNEKHALSPLVPNSMLARDWNPCGAEEDCPPRESGETVRAASATLQVASLDVPEVGEIVSHFGIGSRSIRGLSRDTTWMRFIALIRSENSRWEIVGFSDCEGGEERNRSLRQERADAILHALPAAAQAKIDRTIGASLNDCVGTNDTEWERSLNRSVVFRRTTTTFDFDEENIQVSPPEFVCGPDVTSQVSTAVSEIGTAFSGWTSDQKEEACDALDSVSTGGCAWDIVELHNNAWIHQSYRPTCATQGATPPCGSSVQVGSDCYYAGSANYVIFGKMCHLCADYYLSIPLINTGYARFTKGEMGDLIGLYKGTGISGFATPSANFSESVQWANAGYDGWPSGGSPPPGDRSNCAPMCPDPYRGRSFRVNWAPHQFFTGTCGR